MLCLNPLCSSDHSAALPQTKARNSICTLQIRYTPIKKKREKSAVLIFQKWLIHEWTPSVYAFYSAAFVLLISNSLCAGVKQTLGFSSQTDVIAPKCARGFREMLIAKPARGPILPPHPWRTFL